MWGGSYAGYDQWATAKEFPPHLATIVPVASPYAGIDFPMRGNIASPYLMQWLTFTSGHASQDRIFGDDAFWTCEEPRVVRVGRAVPGLRQVGRQSFADLPGMAGASGAGRVLGQLQPDRRAVREALHPDPDDHRQLRRRPAGRDGALPPVHEEHRRRGARASLPDHRPVGSRRHAHAAGAVRRPDVRAREPGRPAEAASGLVRVDDAGRPEAAVPAEARRVLRHGRGQVALRGHARGGDGRVAPVLSRLGRQRDGRAGSRLARQRAARRASPINMCTTRAT